MHLSPRAQHHVLLQLNTTANHKLMATASRSLRAQWLRKQPQLLTARFQSSFAHLQSELPRRNITPTFDDLSPNQSYRLDLTLADYLPQWGWTPPAVLPPAQTSAAIRHLPIPHHLVYFEPTKRASEMMVDGTNPDHAPGAPFERRMWAGGRVLYNNDNQLQLDGGRAVCAEFIRDVSLKGKEGEEKVFVRIERRLGRASEDEVRRLAGIARGEGSDGGAQAKEDLYHRIRQRLWRDSEEDFGETSILETRSIVFLRGRTAEQAKDEAGKKTAGGKMLKPQHTPDYTHTITPDPKLLFRFSALTFNAHSIHLDPEYSRQVEGHRNLLFHGPLSYTFLVTLLQHKLQQEGNEVVKAVEYRNIAPLYCHEPVKFCGTKMGDGKWEIWAETPEGGIAVKGTAWSEQGRIDKSNLGI